MFSPTAVRHLTANQREILLAHIDAPIAVDLTSHTLNPVRQSLLKIGLLKPHPSDLKRPRHTALTTAGCHAVAAILAGYADALVQAGLLEQESPIAALQQLALMKAGMRPKLPTVVASKAARDKSAQNIGD